MTETIDKNTKASAIEPATEKVALKTVYTFAFGRNIYTVRMSDIKKITLLGHNFIEKKDDKEEIAKTLFIFSVVGDQIKGMTDSSKDGETKPMYETIMEIKAEENDYSTMYNIYEDLVIKWDQYRQLVLTTHRS